MKKVFILIFAVIIGVMFVLSGCDKNTSDKTKDTDGKNETSSFKEDTTKSPDTTEKTPETTVPDTTSGNDNPKIPREYDYSSPMTASSAVGTEFFDDALFIGNSRTRGFITYVGLSKSLTYAYVGLMVNTVFTNPIVDDGGDAPITVMDAIRKHTDWNKVYIMLGTNEIGWESNDYFIQKYGEIIDEIRKIKPEAEIYIQSILPVGIEHGDDDVYYNNPKINTYNPLLLKLAEEKRVYYLNVAEIMLADNGFLFAEASRDGVHINKEYSMKWLEYLKTHTIGGFYGE